MTAQIGGRDLALFGGEPLFASIRSISNLVRPDIDGFLAYASPCFERGRADGCAGVIQELEARLAGLHQADHAVCFCNGLWGIVLTMSRLALPGRSEVVMPSMTYRRLADIAAWVSLTPRFCDSDPCVLGPSVDTVRPCINDQTAMLLIAQPIVKLCDMNGLVELAGEFGVPIVFDSVEAAYASHQGRMIGSFGNAECFSVHASKLLNGFDGGYVATNDGELAQALKRMRSHGRDGETEVRELGMNARMDPLHAAMTLAALDDLEDQVERNRARYLAYKEELAGVKGLDLVEYDEEEIRGYKNILVELNQDWPLSRADTVAILHADNMLVRPYYSPPLHLKETEYATIAADLPVAAELSERYLLLPSGEAVSQADIGKIAEYLRFVQENGPEISGRLKQE